MLRNVIKRLLSQIELIVELLEYPGYVKQGSIPVFSSQLVESPAFFFIVLSRPFQPTK